MERARTEKEGRMSRWTTLPMTSLGGSAPLTHPEHVLNLLAVLHVTYTSTGWQVSWLTESQSTSCVRALFDLAAEPKQTLVWFI